MSARTHKILTYWCFFVAFCLAMMKLYFAYRWWFDGIAFWSEQWRPFPDWGTGSELYGALLPAKWIGTRNLGYCLIILASIFFSHKYKRYQFLGFLLLQGVLIEFFDGFWLANGFFNMGWKAPSEKFYVYMIGGFLWFPFSLSSGIYLLSKERLERAGDNSPAVATT